MGRMLFRIALRNILAHKTGSLIVGTIIFFGTFLAVMGTSMLDSMNRSMSKSIVSSLAGHLQIYSAEARDDLTLFGSFMGGDDFGVIGDFDHVRKELEAHPNVKAVVPMGIQGSIVLQGNEIDLTLSNLRDAVEANDVPQRDALRQKLLNIAADLVGDLRNRLPIAADRAKIEDGLQDLATVQSDEFWQKLNENPEENLLFLDTQLAPLAEDGRIYYLRNLGTDIQRFAQLFDRFEVADGEMIPPGQRGILLSKRVYEKQIKHRVARDFDKIKNDVNVAGKTLAADPILSDIVKRLPRQYPVIKTQLSAQDARTLTLELERALGPVEGKPAQSDVLTAQLERFLTLDDDNFQQRYTQFYELIAPKIRLYALPIGKEFTVRAVTKSGYLKSVRIKVWGTYRFKGLEDSDLAGAQNLVDMLTFRELYGVMSEATKAELQAIKSEVGVGEVSRADAEAALFGDAPPPSAAEPNAAVADLGFEVDERLVFEDQAPLPPYTQEEIDKGLAINAAVILKDDTLLEETKAEIEKLAQERKLGLKVIDWQTAAGIVGQFIIVSRIVLYVAILIIFVVALVIINNSMVMATLERTPEIGTMRAIGAQRRFVMSMFQIETLLLGMLAGAAGALAGASLVRYLGWVGLPAPNDFMVFLFSGPRLFPDFGVTNLVFSFVVVLLVSLASTFYPSLIAARIQPVVAMQPKE